MTNNQFFFFRNVGFSIIFSVGLILSGCNSEQGSVAQQAKSQAGSVQSETGPSGDAANSPESTQSLPNSVTTIGAFIRKSGIEETATKAFEQGVELAISSNPAASFHMKFSDAKDGASSDAVPLKSLVEKEKVAAIVYWSADDIAAVAPFLTSANTLGIVASEVTDKVIPMGADIFGFGFSSELTFTQLAKFAGNTLKSYRIAVISSSEPRFELQRKDFVEETKSLGNTVVFDEKVTAGNTEFSSLIARATQEKTDTIFAVLPSSTLIPFLKAARASRYKGKILVGDTLSSGDLNALGSDAEGIYLVQTWSDDSALRALFAQKHGTSPDGVTLGMVALGYDFAKCIQGMQPPLNADSMKYSLLSQPCEGLTGKTQFTGERIAKRRKRILSVKQGQFVLAE